MVYGFFGRENLDGRLRERVVRFRINFVSFLIIIRCFLFFLDRFFGQFVTSVLREVANFFYEIYSNRYLYARYRGLKIEDHALKHVSHPPATNRVTLGVLAIGCKEFLL